MYQIIEWVLIHHQGSYSFIRLHPSQVSFPFLPLWCEIRWKFCMYIYKHNAPIFLLFSFIYFILIGLCLILRAFIRIISQCQSKRMNRKRKQLWRTWIRLCSYQNSFTSLFTEAPITDRKPFAVDSEHAEIFTVFFFSGICSSMECASKLKQSQLTFSAPYFLSLHYSAQSFVNSHLRQQSVTESTASVIRFIIFHSYIIITLDGRHTDCARIHGEIWT